MNDNNDNKHDVERALHHLGASAFPDETDLRPAIHRRLAERHVQRGRTPALVGWRLLPATAIALIVAVAGLTLIIIQPWDSPPPANPRSSWAQLSEDSLLAMQRLRMIEEHGLDPAIEEEQDEQTPSQR